MRISVCYIVKNEEKWLQGAIENLKPIVDEFIIVDTGSSDRTLEIAQSLGAKIYHFKWINDFAAARNFAISKATGDWILNVDPDERIAEKDLGLIPQLVREEAIEGFTFVVRNYTHDSTESGFRPCAKEYPTHEQNYPGFFETRRVKLFRRLPHIQFCGAVHELVEKSIQGLTLLGPFPIHHYGHLAEEISRKSKTENYLTGLIRKVQEEGQNWVAHLELGVAYMKVEDFAKAALSFERSLELHYSATAFAQLGFCYEQTQNFQKAEEVLSKGLRFFPASHDLLLNYACFKGNRGLWNEAFHLAQLLIVRHSDSFLGYRLSGYALLNLNRIHEALPFLTHSLRIYPQGEDARVDLGIAYLSMGNHDAAKRTLDEALRISPTHPRVQGLMKAMQESNLAH